ncbi:Non-catalytic module family DOC2, partial [Piromyces sp. E2]
CWSLSFGYSCCRMKDTEIAYTSRSTGKELYYGVENGQWCGITDIQLCPSGGLYKCCQGCEIVFTDSQDWGIENGHWCSIPRTCNSQNNNK